MDAGTLPPVKDLLRQKEPFVFVDAIQDFTKEKSLTGIKNITSEWEKGRPLSENSPYPEMLIVEGAVQTAYMLYVLSRCGKRTQKPQFILGKVTAEFKDSAGIGDRLQYHAKAVKMMDRVGQMEVTVRNERSGIGEITFTYALKDKK